VFEKKAVILQAFSREKHKSGEVAIREMLLLPISFN
jgi:hypothetical protein